MAGIAGMGGSYNDYAGSSVVRDDAYNDAPKREPQVRAQAMVLSVDLEELERALTVLEQQLQPVLRTEPEPTAQRDKEIEVTMVQVAELFAGAAKRVQRLAAGVVSVTRRLEI